MQPQDQEGEQCTGRQPRGTTEALAGGLDARVRMLSFYFHPNYSGSAVQAHNLSLCLLQRGIKAEVVSANLTDSPATDRIDGLTVHRLPLVKTKSLQIPSFMVTLAWHLLCNRRDFEIVHAHGTYQHAVASAVCRLLGKRSILKIAMGNSDIAFHRQGRVWGRVNRFLVKRFDRYIATSHDVYLECLSQGLEPSRVLLIPNGVDINRYRPVVSDDEKRCLKRELRLPDIPIVCFVGIIDARKNIDGILRVWQSTMRKGVVGHLVLVGPQPEDSDEKLSDFCEQARRFVAEEGLGASVTFVGRQADVALYLRSADVFLFPSRREGMPNALLEAMSSGLACVASDISGSADLIENGRNGYLFDLDDEDGMSAAVSQLLEAPALARKIGLAARETAVDRFSLEATAEQYLRLYRELLAERSMQPIRTHDSGGSQT